MSDRVKSDTGKLGPTLSRFAKVRDIFRRHSSISLEGNGINITEDLIITEVIGIYEGQGWIKLRSIFFVQNLFASDLDRVYSKACVFHSSAISVIILFRSICC